MTASKRGLVPEFYVTDIAASRHFYVEILGFEVLFERPEEGFLYLAREDAELMLDAVDQGRSWITGPMTPPFGRGVNLQIWTADVTALYRRVQEADTEVYLELEEKWYRIGKAYGGNRQFIVQDPDGYLLRFAQDLGERESIPSD